MKNSHCRDPKMEA
jgi:transposase InsO family protein